MYKIISIVFVAALMFTSCAASRTSSSLDQGIRGKVVWVEGNQMPGPGRKTNVGAPVVRELLIYEVLKMNELERKGSLFVEPTEKPVIIVKSDESGNFEATLPVGVYSILTREEDGLFANSFDGDNNVMPVEVLEGEYTEVNITINYKAVY